MLQNVSKMLRYEGFICICLFVLVGCALTKRCKVLNEYRMDISDELCKPCSRSSMPNLETLSFSEVVCPNVTNITQVFVKQLEDKLRTVAALLRTDERKFTKDLNADDTFVPMEIEDLKSVDDSKIATYLRNSNKPEEVLHKIYARIILLSAHIGLSRCLVDDLKTLTSELRMEMNKNLLDMERQIIPISCQLYAFTELLGVSKIKKKICRYAKRIKGLDTASDETDFILTVLKNGAKYANESVSDLQALPAYIRQCEYKSCTEGKMKLSCNEDNNTSDDRRSRRQRGDRKDRQSRKSKNRKGKKNKRGKKCKNNSSSKDQIKKNKKCRRRRNKTKNEP